MEATSIRPVSVKLDQTEHDRLKSLAEARHRKPHFLMKEAINQYLDREEARESFKREALASWQEYKETGQNLTAEQVSAWLDTWGSEREKAIPPCHD
jgi:predicted transcriptional regulator